MVNPYFVFFFTAKLECQFAKLLLVIASLNFESFDISGCVWVNQNGRMDKQDVGGRQQIKKTRNAFCELMNL